MSSKNWVYLYSLDWYRSTFIFFKKFPFLSLKVGWKNESYQNFFLMMRMTFLTVELVISRHYTSDEIVKTGFLRNSFFLSYPERVYGEFFEKMKLDGYQSKLYEYE